MKRIVIYLVLLGWMSAVKTQTNINPFGGAGRTGAVSFVINDTVYIGLGKDGSAHYKDFWKYSKSEDQWVQIADFPGEARAYAQAFVLGEKAYIGLGRQYEYGNVDTTYQDFYRYDPVANSWTRLNDFAGGARESAVGFMLNDTAYIGTGVDNNGKCRNDFWKYNGTTDSWTAVTAEFTGNKRGSAMAFSIDGKAYVTGGFYFDSYSVQLSDVHEYDPVTNSWTEKIFADGINLSVNDGSAIGFRGKGYILYGNKDKVVSYNPLNNEVKDLGNILSLEDSRMNPVCFELDDTVYFGLGYYSHDDGSVFGVDSYDNHIYRLDLPKPTAPVDIQLSSNSIDEGLVNGSQVGILSSTDNSESTSHFYKLVDDESYPDNLFFSISDTDLLANKLDYESQNSYRIMISSTNDFGLSLKKEFTINVNDVTEQPQLIEIDKKSIYENLPENSFVGKLSTEDQNQEVSHTYALIDTENYPDNNSFSISGDSLLATILDYEAKSIYTIKIRSVNTYDQTVDEVIDIYVTDDPSDNDVINLSITDSLDEYYSFDQEKIINKLNPQMVATSYNSNYQSGSGVSAGCWEFGSENSKIDFFDFEPESFSINIWFNTSDTSRAQRILHKGERGGSPRELFSYSLLYFNNVFRFSIGNHSGIGAINLYSTNKVVENTWYRITCTFNHATRYANLYVNGEFQSGGVAQNTLIQTNEVLKVGYYPNITEDNQPIIGLIDELGLWSRVLSGDEVSKLHYLTFSSLTTKQNHEYIRVYPNPAQNKLYVDLDLGIIYYSEIYSAIGAMVLKSGNSTAIDVSSLKPATYYMKIVTSSGIYFRNICIVK